MSAKNSKIDPNPPCPLLSPLGHTPSPPCARLQRPLNTHQLKNNSRTSSRPNYQMSVSDCCWHWHSAGCGLSPIYCLYLKRLSLQYCELRFIQLVTLSLFCRRGSPHSLNPPPSLLDFVRTGPYPLPLRADVLYGWVLRALDLGWSTTTGRRIDSRPPRWKTCRQYKH